MKRHGETSKCILLSERRQSEKVIYCMIPTIWNSGKDKTIKMVKDQWLPKERSRDEQAEHGGFLDCENTLYGNITMGNVVIYLPKPMECTSPGMRTLC